MEYSTLNNSQLTVSRLGLGGCPLGGYGWGKTEKRDLVGAIYAALENGITFFDTAPIYGLGHSESLLGATLGKHRQKVSIATKFGVRVENGRTWYDNSPAWIKSSLTGSLKRLKTDYIDLYQIHYRDDKTPLAEVVETLEDLKTQGLIRYLGLSNIYLPEYEELKNVQGRFVSFQNEYSLAYRTHENDILTLAEKLELTPMTWGSLGQGLLTGKYGPETKFAADDRRSRLVYRNFHGPALAKNLKILDTVKDIARETHKSPVAVALRFILDKIPNSLVLAGAKKPAQITDQVESMNWRLTEEHLLSLEGISQCRAA